MIIPIENIKSKTVLLWKRYDFWGKLNTENECVAELMGIYKELTEKQLYAYWVRKEAIP